ncbi:MAG: ATP-dependent metallopeptidase FtsH/Yme1/Tma family protein, partial [Candidatus Eremiobacteraeota bacterium]|nr:ATP-dependent metallopeptidase FtsH/Yme1/Tma family protein [Candidatus Eremiobacteraeota bacterium]
MGKHLRTLLIIGLVLVVVFVIVQKFVLPPGPTSKLTYSDFYSRVEQNKIKKVTIIGHEISGEMMNSGERFTTTTPEDKDLLPVLRAHHVDVTAEQPSNGALISN